MLDVIDHYTHPLSAHVLTIGQTCEATQEVPLLKAKDGALIVLGESGYGEDGVKYTITGLGTEYVWGRADGSKIDKRLKPEWLTSKRPDSWEQLEKDLSRVGCSKAIAMGIVARNEKGRIECHIPCDDCNRLMAKAFIRRAKALAGVE